MGKEIRERFVDRLNPWSEGKRTARAANRFLTEGKKTEERLKLALLRRKAAKSSLPPPKFTRRQIVTMGAAALTGLFLGDIRNDIKAGRHLADITAQPFQPHATATPKPSSTPPIH